MSRETAEILANPEAIALDQDSLGIQGYRYDSKDSLELWVKPLIRGDWAVCFLNRSSGTKRVDFDWSQSVIADDFSKRTLNTNDVVYRVRDVWHKKNLRDTQRALKAEVSSRDVLLLRLTKQ